MAGSVRLEMPLEERPDPIPGVTLGLAVDPLIATVSVDTPVERMAIPVLVDGRIDVDACFGEVWLRVLERVDQLLGLFEVDILVVVGDVHKERRLQLVDLIYRRAFDIRVARFMHRATNARL